MFRESGPQSNIKFEEKVKKWYQEVLTELEDDNFKVTPAESVFLRQTIRDVFNENDKIMEDCEKSGKKTWDAMATYPEIFDRFFWHFYGINLPEYYKSVGIETPEDIKKATKDLYKYVQEKLRKDGELV